MLNITDLLIAARDKNASDIHLTAGMVPVIRVYGELQPLPYRMISEEDIREYFCMIANEEQKNILKKHGDIDMANTIDEVECRLRIQFFLHQQSMAMAVRILDKAVPKIETLGLPMIVSKWIDFLHGLILVTGPSGSGKTTTMAAMLGKINQERACHIVTLEDPIEYIHVSNKALIHQREIGFDTVDFHRGLRAALRENPDVIMVGEIRDAKTASLALSAAETGHLVFATLHTNSAVEAIERFLGMFSPTEQSVKRMELSLVLQGVLSQRLLPKITGKGRVLATEILVANSAVRNIIREGKNPQLITVMQTGGRYGMHRMQDSLQDLYKREMISEKFLKQSLVEE